MPDHKSDLGTAELICRTAEGEFEVVLTPGTMATKVEQDDGKSVVLITAPRPSVNVSPSSCYYDPPEGFTSVDKLPDHEPTDVGRWHPHIGKDVRLEAALEQLCHHVGVKIVVNPCLCDGSPDCPNCHGLRAIARLEDVRPMGIRITTATNKTGLDL